QRPDAKRFSDSEWLDKKVEIIRQAWGITDFTSSVRENPTWFQFPASRVLVLYPEWPNIPYLDIDRAERLRRVKEFSVPMTKEDRLASLAYLLDPTNPWVGEKSVAEIGIPRSLSHEVLNLAFAAKLKLEFPSQGKCGNHRRRRDLYSRIQG